MIGYQNSRLRFLRLVISRLRCGLVWLGISKSLLRLTEIVGYLVVGYHIFLHKNVSFLPISWLRFAAVVYPT